MFVSPAFRSCRSMAEKTVTVAPWVYIVATAAVLPDSIHKFWSTHSFTYRTTFINVGPSWNMFFQQWKGMFLSQWKCVCVCVCVSKGRDWCCAVLILIMLDPLQWRLASIEAVHGFRVLDVKLLTLFILGWLKQTSLSLTWANTVWLGAWPSIRLTLHLHVK